MQESLKKGEVTTLPGVNTIADGTAVKTPGTSLDMVSIMTMAGSSPPVST